MEGADEALPPFWDELVKLGWLGLHLPEEYGGEGYGLSELAVVLEELGRTCAPGPFLPTVLASAVIDAIGTDDQKARWLPGLADGSILGAIALGELRPVLGADLADLVVVLLGLAGGSWAVLEGDSSGPWLCRASTPPATSRRSRSIGKPSHPTSSSRRRRVRQCTWRSLAASSIAAECVGGAAWCVETAAEYAQVREQFGRPIGQFQAVKHRCADMLLRLEQARAVRRGMQLAAARPPSTSRSVRRGDHRRQRVLRRRQGLHPGARRHRLHVGSRRAPLLEARAIVAPAA